MPLPDVVRQRVQPLASAVTSHRVFLYAIFSTFALAATVANACRAQNNFYSVSIHLARSSRAVLVLANFGFICALVFGRILQRMFFGALQPREVERLYDQTWMFVTESLLAFTIFRDEFDVPFLFMFGFLLFVKCFHWLMADRVESMDQTTYPGPPALFHIRMNGLFAVLSIVDTIMFTVAVESTLTNGVGGMVLFASEYAILMATALNAVLRYSLSILDLRRARARGGENAPPWENKSMYIFYIELLTDFLKLTTYLTFFLVILTFYGLPLNIIRDVFVTARSFITRLRALVRYHNATRDMDRRYPDATEEELAGTTDRTCIICREEMHRPAAANGTTDAAGDANANAPAETTHADAPNMAPKKLPCGHIFHFQCLRSWLERQQNCPTCRRTVLEGERTNADRLRPAPPRPGAVPQPGRPQPGQQPQQPQQQLGGAAGWMARFLGLPPPPPPQPAAPPVIFGPFGQQGPPPGWPVGENGQPVLPMNEPIPLAHPQDEELYVQPPGVVPPPPFRGFYGPGNAYQYWVPPGMQPPNGAAQGVPNGNAPGMPNGSGPVAPNGSAQGQQNGAAGPTRPNDIPHPASAPPAPPSATAPPAINEPSPREAAALAAFRRLNPGAPTPIPIPSTTTPTPTTPSSSTNASTSAVPASAPSTSTPQPPPPPTQPAPTRTQPAAPTHPGGPPLVPLFDPWLLTHGHAAQPYQTQPFSPLTHVPARQVGAHQRRGGQAPQPYRAGMAIAAVPRNPQPQPPPPALGTLPATLTAEQLARLDTLTREAIDERLRVLDAVGGAVWRCVEELTRVRSVLPRAGVPTAAGEAANVGGSGTPSTSASATPAASSPVEEGPSPSSSGKASAVDASASEASSERPAVAEMAGTSSSETEAVVDAQ